VTVTVQGTQTGASLRFPIETRESVRGKTILCRMRKLLQVNMFINPLWDPRRDYVARPPSKRELGRIVRFATELRALAEKADKLMK
jgi:hypothetical protein